MRYVLVKHSEKGAIPSLESGVYDSIYSFENISEFPWYELMKTYKVNSVLEKRLISKGFFIVGYPMIEKNEKLLICDMDALDSPKRSTVADENYKKVRNAIVKRLREDKIDSLV